MNSLRARERVPFTTGEEFRNLKVIPVPVIRIAEAVIVGFDRDKIDWALT